MLGLILLIPIGGLLETAGVSLVLPLISAILDEESFASNRYVIWFMETLNIGDVRKMIYLLIIALILMYIIKNSFAILLIYLQSRFVNKNRSRWKIIESPSASSYTFYMSQYQFAVNDVTLVVPLCELPK